MSYIHIPFKTLWLIVPMNKVMHKGPLQNICPYMSHKCNPEPHNGQSSGVKGFDWERHRTVHHNQGGDIFDQQPSHSVCDLHPVTQCVFTFPIGRQQLPTTFSQLICTFLFYIFQYWHSGEINKISF